MNIIHLVSNKVWGGGEQYVLDLTTELASDGNNVTIVARNIPKVTQRFKDAHLPVVTMPLKGTLDLISPIRLAAMLRKLPEAVVHVHNFKDAITAVRARKLSGNRNVRIAVTRHLVKPAKKNTGYNNLDAIIFVSQLVMDKFLSTSPNVDRNRLHLIHNSIKYVPEHNETPKRNEILTLMFHGRISPEKGLETLIEAFATIRSKDTRLLIAGSGNAEYTETLHKLCDKLGISQQTEWTGHIDNIHPLIEKADIGICPSVCRESFGLAVIEYMAHGKAVITTDNGAQREYITNGTDGILVSPASVEETAKAIEELKDETRRKQMGQMAKKTFESRLSYPIFYKAVCKVYKSLLAK